MSAAPAWPDPTPSTTTQENPMPTDDTAPGSDTRHLAAIGEPVALSPRTALAAIARYLTLVAENTTDDYDALAAVAADEDGEVWWEVVATAESDIRILFDDGGADQFQDAWDPFYEALRALAATLAPEAST